MEAECCIFMLFLRLRMLSEDWYTWMLTETEMKRNQGLVKRQSYQQNQKLSPHVSVCHTPSVLCPQPHWALVGLGVDAEQILQTRPGEGTAGGSAHGTAIHGALSLGTTSSSNPQDSWRSVGTCHWEFLLLFTAGGLCSHFLGAGAFVIFTGKRSQVMVCRGEEVNEVIGFLTHFHSWMRWWSDWPDSVGWRKGWESLHHLCHRCQMEPASPLFKISRR